MIQADEALAQAAQEGDADALTPLIRRYYPAVFSFARRVLRSSEDAEDAAQETFFKVHKYLSRYERKSRFSTWLHSVGRNTVADHLRRRKRRAVVGGPVDPDAVPVRLAGRTAAAGLRLEDLVAVLPLQERHLVIRIYRDGISIRRLAAMMGVTTNFVRWRLLKALRRLRSVVR